MAGFDDIPRSEMNPIWAQEARMDPTICGTHEKPAPYLDPRVRRNMVDGTDRDSVVYFGLNTSREEEAKVFNNLPGATVITGQGEKDQSLDGMIPGRDGKMLDLRKPADIKKFLGDVGLDEEQEKHLYDLFVGGNLDADGEKRMGIDVGSRDEIAQLIQVAALADKGELDMDRFVISGHSVGTYAYREDHKDQPAVTFADIAMLMNEFPHARDGVQDLMMSACHTLEDSPGVYETSDGSFLKPMFPQMDTAVGYHGQSPDAATGSLAHLAAWERASRGHDEKKNRAAVKAMADAYPLRKTATGFTKPVAKIW